jgi:hypothetical protein
LASRGTIPVGAGTGGVVVELFNFSFVVVPEQIEKVPGDAFEKPALTKRVPQSMSDTTFQMGTFDRCLAERDGNAEFELVKVGEVVDKA